MMSTMSSIGIMMMVGCSALDLRTSIGSQVAAVQEEDAQALVTPMESYPLTYSVQAAQIEWDKIQCIDAFLFTGESEDIGGFLDRTSTTGSCPNGLVTAKMLGFANTNPAVVGESLQSMAEKLASEAMAKWVANNPVGLVWITSPAETVHLDNIVMDVQKAENYCLLKSVTHVAFGGKNKEVVLTPPSEGEEVCNQQVSSPAMTFDEYSSGYGGSQQGDQGQYDVDIDYLNEDILQQQNGDQDQEEDI